MDIDLKTTDLNGSKSLGILPAEKKEVKGDKSHGSDGQIVLNIRLTSQSKRQRKDDAKTTQKKSTSRWTQFEILPKEFVTQKSSFMNSDSYVNDGPNDECDFASSTDLFLIGVVGVQKTQIPFLNFEAVLAF